MWDPEQAIRSELLSSEILCWTGRPAVARVLLASGLPILFLVSWEAMAIYAAVSPVRAWLEEGRPQDSLPLAHVAMVIAGLLFLAKTAGPMFAASRTAYGITNRRIIVVSRLTARRVQSVEGASIDGVGRTERSNGSGDVVIRSGGQADCSLALIGVPDVRQVTERVEQLRASSLAAADRASGLLRT